MCCPGTPAATCSTTAHHRHHHKRRSHTPVVQKSLEEVAKTFQTHKIVKPYSAKVAICCAFKAKPMMFDAFEPDYFIQMVDSMVPLSAQDGEVVITQGDSFGEYFYAIEKGKCDVEVNGRVVATLPNEKAGNGFGELALMLNSARNATVRSRGECKLWTLSRTTFRVMQYRQKIRKVVDACDSLRRVKLLSDLDDKQIISIAEAVEIQRYNEGDIIIQKGDTEGRDFYMIQEGLVEVRDITGAPKLLNV